MRNYRFCSEYRTVILPGDTQRTTSELPDVGAKLEAWRLKMFHSFHFLQSDMVFGITNSFSWIFDAVSSEKRCLTSILFLLTYIELRTVDFPRLLNPDWSIQISGASAVCKASGPPYLHSVFRMAISWNKKAGDFWLSLDYSKPKWDHWECQKRHVLELFDYDIRRDHFRILGIGL